MVQWRLFALVAISVVVVVVIYFQIDRVPSEDLEPSLRETIVPVQENKKTPVDEQAFKKSIYDVFNATEQLMLEPRVVEDVDEGVDLVGPKTEDKVLPVSDSKSKIDLQLDGSGQEGTDFDYGYKRTLDDKHGVRVGVKDKGVSVSTEVKTDPEGVEVQQIQIEVDLPK